MEFANLLKTSRESAGITQGQAAEKLSVTEKTISNWETGAILPPTDKCQGIGSVYGIDRETLLASYDNAVWPQENVSEEFPVCLFNDSVLPYITSLRFTPQEVELIRMLEIYSQEGWEFSSLSEAYKLLRKLPYGYVSRVGVSVLPQMMMDISEKLWPTRDAHSHYKSYDSTLKEIVVRSVMLPQDGEPLASFSVSDLPLEEILETAENAGIAAPDGGYYLCITDHHTLDAIGMISQGKDEVCISQARLNNNGTDYSMDPEWKEILCADRYSYYPENEIEKNDSPWISYDWKDKDNQSVCIATPTEKGKQLLEFYRKHMDLFEDQA